jgi:predicted RNA-binding Zn ribbon-like protein
MTEPKNTESIETMGLNSGHLCLDFANTANWHASEQPVEYLTQYADLITWGRRTQTLSETEARRLAKAAADHPAAAERTLHAAIALREAVYDIFTDLAQGASPSEADLGVLNAFLAEAMARARVAPSGAGFAWEWDEAEARLDRMLWPVARSAADLLTSPERERVGQCADDRGCGWLFLDMSRNHSRRWCDMKDCGNRAKARRHYQKQRAEAQA